MFSRRPIRTRRRNSASTETLELRVLLSASTAGDFNNDGYDDLALGVPNKAIGDVPLAGAVSVSYGRSSGISGIDSQLWSQGSSGIGETPESGDEFGAALAIGDFNDDGYDDLAIGVPGETIGGDRAGAVNVIYGSSTGLRNTNDQVFSQDTSGINEIAEEGDRFGAALVAGDFNDDGYADLAIGVPGDDVGADTAAGIVNVIFGSASGLTSTGDQHWHQDKSGVPETTEVGDQFGASLAAGDYNNDGRTDLAIGIPYESVGTKLQAGAIQILDGSSSGLVAVSGRYWHQNSTSIASSSKTDGAFGLALTSGDFDNDSYDDLAIGSPNSTVDGVAGAGAVQVLYGSADSVNGDRDQYWHQNIGGIADVVEINTYGDVSIPDNYGASLVAGDFDGNGRDDLAVGIPGESIGDEIAGAVNVLYGSSTGLRAGADQLWNQNSTGIAEKSEHLDYFGASVAAADLNGDGNDDLIAGVPGESITTGGIAEVSAGAATIIFGSSSKLNNTGDRLWHLGVSKVAGSVLRGDRFGAGATGNSSLLTYLEPTPTPFELEVLSLTNAERVAHGCGELTIDSRLQELAQRHTADMVANDRYSHAASDDSSNAERVLGIGYDYRSTAENIAAGYLTAEDVVTAWMDSAGHRANILNCGLTEIGVGYSYDSNDTGLVTYGRYWAQVFGDEF